MYNLESECVNVQYVKNVNSYNYNNYIIAILLIKIHYYKYPCELNHQEIKLYDSAKISEK